jgi:hypothetical protein
MSKLIKVINGVIKEEEQAREMLAKIEAVQTKVITLEDVEPELVYLKRQALLHKPRNNEELWNCVKINFGVEIPYTATAEWTNAPFQWFSDLFFGRTEQSVALAARNSGKTFLGSKLHYLWNTWSVHGISRHAAATKEQAKVASAYLQMFARDTALSEVFLKGQLNKMDAVWRNGSNWAIVTGTIQGVSGQHPDKATWDEIEFWDIDAIEQTWYVPTDRGNNFRIWAAFSTRQRSFGAMNWLVEEAPKRDVKLYAWTAFETMKRCPSCIAIDEAPYGSDAERSKVCNLWEDCHGKRGTKATGWVPRSTVCKMKRTLSANAWKVQGLCEKPSSHGLVLHNFVHQYKPEGNYTRWIFDPRRLWYATHDPSEGKKSVIYFIQVDDDGNDHVFDEINDPECPDVTKAKVEFYERCLERGYGDPEVIVVDPHRTDAMQTWRGGSRGGTRAGRRYNADVPPTDRASGGQEIDKTIEFLRHAICDGEGTRNFFINPETCPLGVKGIKEYHYPMDANGKLTSETPAKAYSDEIDPLRYWRMYRKTKLKHKFGTSGRSGRRIRVI